VRSSLLPGSNEAPPGARLEVIRGAGHSSNLDQPEAFNRVLLDFLGSLPA
jgi:pimeloyl-ACP methyl ester carboxylesterase